MHETMAEITNPINLFSASSSDFTVMQEDTLLVLCINPYEIGDYTWWIGDYTWCQTREYG